MWVSMDGLETMPIWCPPTPPQDENDIYIDVSLAHLYETQVMDESRLPPVFVQKELKRVHKETNATVQHDDGRRPAKIRKEETVYAPRSLFDRPSPALAKLRRDLKLQKFRGIVRTPIPLPNLTLKPPIPARPLEEAENTPEWLVHEDWILLQAVQNLLELPLNLVILTPAHTPNWDLVADMVNSYSRSYRSPKQCRNRYIGVILPREEGKAAIDNSPKKIKKATKMVKNNGRPMRTSQMYISDNNASFTTTWHHKFDTLKSIFHKKAPTNRSIMPSTNTGSTARSGANAKHAGVLIDNGITYDSPLNPVQVAAVRAERIAQKQKSAAAMAEQQVQIQQQQQQQRVAIAPGSPATPSSPLTAARSTPVASPSTSNLAAVNQTLNASASPSTMNSLSAAGSQQHTLLVQGTAPQGSATQQQLVLQTATGVRTQRPVAAPGQQQPNHQTVVTVGNLTAVQVQAAAQMLASAGIAVSSSGQLNTITTTATGAKGAAVTMVQTGGTTGASAMAVAAAAAGAKTTLSPSQVQYIRQQAMVKQHQKQLQEQQLKKLQLAAGSTSPQTGGASASGAQKLPMVTAVTTISNTVSAFNTVQIAGQSPSARAQLLKGGTATTLIGKGGTTVARAIVTEVEMAALIKRQQQLHQQKTAANAAAASSMAGSVSQQQQTVQIGTTAQLLAQAGLQVQTSVAGGQPQVATLVKTVSAPGTIGGAPSVTIPVSAISVGLPQVQVKGLTTNVKTSPATQQQLRQFTIQHQLLQARKNTQQQSKSPQLAQTVTLGTVKGNVVVPTQQLGTVGTVQLVQPVGANTASGSAAGMGGSKPGSMSTTVTMQQLQQVIRQVSAGGQVLVSSPSSGASAGGGTTLLTKAPQGQTVQTRMIPVSQQGLKQQTIQVVTTGQPGSAGGSTRVATLNAASGNAMASALAAGTWKVAGGTEAQQKALFSQVSAVLQSGQPVSIAVKAGSAGTGPRILTAGSTFSTTAATTATVSVTNTTTTASAVGSIASSIKSPDIEPSTDNS